MTPLERAARALARRSCPPGGEAQFPYVSADEWEAKNWRDHIPAARAVLTAIRDALDESGLVEAARQAAEIDGSTAATWASMTYDDVLAWFDATLKEE